MIRFALTAALTIAALTLTSCGGGGGMSATTTGGMTDTPNMDMREALPFPVTGRNRDAMSHETGTTSVAHMPVVDDGRYFYVGVDQGEHLDDLAVSTIGGIEVYSGTLNDGIIEADVREYLQGSVRNSYRMVPTVRVIGPSSATERRRVEAAVRLVNAALPEGVKIRVDAPRSDLSLSDTTASDVYYRVGQEDVDTIQIEFLPCSLYRKCGTAAATTWSVHGNDPRAYIQMNRGANVYGDDRRHTILLAHELIHAMGLDMHPSARFDTILENTSDIYATHQSSPAPMSVLYPIDRAALWALYSPTSLGSWASESQHIAIGGAHGNFGVALRNGRAEPWAHGIRPATSLARNAGLSGTVTWGGVLVGFTPSAEAVVGGAAIVVNLATLAGRADFTELTWSRGDLGYTIAVIGNTFRETGGDAGRLTGVFAGRNHEAAGGTLQRTDLTAAFGAERMPLP